jgi:hypothetical protein
MATNRTRRGRNRRAVPEDYWNLLLCRPLNNKFMQFYCDKWAAGKDLPTLAETFKANEATVRSEWERTGKHPDKGQLKEWGIT